LLHAFTEGIHIICLDIIDSRGACGSICYELDLTAAEEDETDPMACTYSSCLDGSGLPNLVAMEFLTTSGELVTIDKNTEGFFFPYCDGTPSMCNGGESEVELFVEDLNAYFYKHDIDALASSGSGSDLFESICRSLAVTIISSDIIPTGILIDDFSTEELVFSFAQFEFDPTACGASLEGGNLNDQAITFVPEAETDQEINVVPENFNPVVSNGQLEFEKTDSNENKEVVNEEIIVSQVSIFTLGGNKILSINEFKEGDTIDIDHLNSGMYVVNLVNRIEQK